MSHGRDRWIRLAGIAGVFALGLLGILATAVSVSRARDDAAARDEQAVNVAAERVSVGLQSALASLRGADGMGADGELTPEEFKAFATDVVASTDYAALSFSEIVPDDQRAEWEADNYPMIDLSDGAFVPAGDRDVHVVVREVEPVDDLTRALYGFDLAGEPTRASGIEVALEDDDAVVGPIALARSQAPGIFVIRAVRDADGKAIGFISAGLAADALLGQADSDEVPEVGLWIDGEPLLEGSQGDGQRAEFEVAGRQFTVEADDPRNTSWLLPAIIGVCTALLCAAALVALRRARRDRERERRIAKRNERLSRVATDLAESISTERIIELVTETGIVVLAAELAEFARIDPADSRTLLVASRRSSTPVAPASRVDRKQSIDGGLPLSESARTGRLVAMTDGSDYVRRHPAASEIATTGIRTSICAPLSFGGQLSAGSIGFGWSRVMSEDEIEDTTVAVQLITQMAGRAFDREVVRVVVQERVELLREFAQLLSAARSTAEIEELVESRLPELLAIETAQVGVDTTPPEGLTRTYRAPHMRGIDLHLRLLPATEWNPTLEALTQAVVELIEAAWLRASDQEHEHDVLQRLTESLLLPAPTIDGLDIAVAYRSAIETVGIGGDWYSVIERDDVVHFVIGDIAGHGPGAVAIMAEAKSVLRHLLTAGTSIEAALEQADSVLRRRDAFASVIAVSVDKRREELTYLNAGHPFPILRTPDGITLLTDLHRPWLGIADRSKRATRVPFPTGSTLLLYSDGLVEDRRESIDTSIQRLVDKVESGSTRPQLLVDQLLADRQEERTATTLDDDIAVIAVERCGIPVGDVAPMVDLELTTPDSARLAREALAPILDGATRQSAQAALLVASELVSNAVMHADGTGMLRAWPAGGALRIEVTDDEPLRLPTTLLTDPSDTHGRGLRLVSSLSRDWGIRVDRSTKTVWAEVELEPPHT